MASQNLLSDSWAECPRGLETSTAFCHMFLLRVTTGLSATWPSAASVPVHAQACFLAILLIFGARVGVSISLWVWFWL